MGQVHDLAFNLLLALVALHILAVLYYQRGRKQPLVQAMLRGKAAGKEGLAAPVSAWWALLTAALVALALWGLLTLAPAPAPLMW